jgi:1,4-alpha-glucan branching enzyme
MVALTGRRAAYYSDYRGTPQEFISALKRGYLYQGQRYIWQQQRRGTPAFDLKPATFVTFLQNHDQIANSDGGDGVIPLEDEDNWHLPGHTATVLRPHTRQGQEG